MAVERAAVQFKRLELRKVIPPNQHLYILYVPISERERVITRVEMTKSRATIGCAAVNYG